MKPVNATLRLSKSTKGTHVYAEPEDREDKTFPTIYIQKSALPDDPPKTIKVTIELPEKKVK